VLAFSVTAVAVALLAAVVARSVDQLGGRLGAGATGVVQSALGNLPELFIVLFALRAGLTQVATSAIIGSILANVLLVLGLAFVVGGLRNGTQSFSPQAARLAVVLMLLSVAAMLIPSLTSSLHSPAAGHEKALSVITSVVLLVVFAASVPASLRAGSSQIGHGSRDQARWSFALTIGVLVAASVLAAVVSDWFVAALDPAMASVGVSDTFAGLVVVAIAGNAVENVVGISLAAQNKPDHALSVVLNSPVQIALAVAPAVVLLSPLVGASFTLVFPPLLVASVAIAMLVVTVIVLDGESNWLEGVALVGLYVLMASSFWWG
jgi:Ca2+:H+ antiporter